MSTPTNSHQLRHKWTLYFNDPPKPTKHQVHKDDWHDALHTIALFDTVETFWRVCHNIPQPSDIPVKSAYYFFHTGIRPAWEDEANIGGGRFLCQFRKAAQKYEDESIFFDMTLLIMCNQFPGIDFINGIGFNKERSRLEVWVRKGLNHARVEALKQEMTDTLNTLFSIKNSKITLRANDFLYSQHKGR
ncbi:putative eukaryotic translation initiation factor 4E1 [Blattamonas nauphoetae]|uniref:Eukaryotic translation initiation factor 4E1 n=1 Tax=Blattamonas nauphoetae TaxID=2049346 RepID=A0ABQ9X8T2_9EUKA|nr:putative eukaryotic translation initiation factor 4E1 [Blattamonas nauphoetae]